MVAALYSSRNTGDGGTKSFKKGGALFGWSSIEAVYRSDMSRAEQGISRRVPGLKYAYVVRDSWTRLNVLPAKIMQQPYMIAAIKEMAEKHGNSSDTCTAEYLEACSFIFEQGTLSHDKVESSTCRALRNIIEGLKWFTNWKEELQSEPDVKFRSPLQKAFLSWQTWDLLLIMVNGFVGLCEDFLSRHPRYFIAPIRINGSAVESIFSCLKYIAGGNLSSINYSPSLSSLITQKNVQNPSSEKGYRTDVQSIH